MDLTITIFVAESFLFLWVIFWIHYLSTSGDEQPSLFKQMPKGKST